VVKLILYYYCIIQLVIATKPDTKRNRKSNYVVRTVDTNVLQDMRLERT